MAKESVHTTRQRLDRLAWLLDSSIPLPGGFRVGLDGIIGMIPGIGDAAGAAMSSYILAQAAQLGVPRSTLLLMGFNILIESVIGLIPFAGDIFDFAWKSNQRNVKLLHKYLDNPQQTTKESQAVSAVIVIVIIVGVITIFWLGLKLLGALWGAITG